MATNLINSRDIKEKADISFEEEMEKAMKSESAIEKKQ